MKYIIGIDAGEIIQPIAHTYTNYGIVQWIVQVDLDGARKRLERYPFDIGEIYGKNRQETIDEVKKEILKYTEPKGIEVEFDISIH